ncbi:MAG: response regulator [Lachnospiraceae bacterium]|nr:response regulator [Lachnospiraceae bacterium]
MAKILIVDDSRTSRKMLRQILEDGGHEVLAEAVDGEDGFIKCKELQPELVTMDITMPKLNGLECLKLIKEKYPDIKVVMISAAGQKEKVVDAIKHGAADFIMKPYDDDEVLAIIQKIYA